jgi:hypothetical protein
MWARLFGAIVWILDFFHVLRRLAECAHEVVLPGAPFEKLLGKWKAWLYDGKIDSLLRSLRMHARRFADRPTRPSDLPEASPRRILWAHVFYIEKYCDYMNYPTYRRNGWPIGSGHAESLAGQVGAGMGLGVLGAKIWTAAAVIGLVAAGLSAAGVTLAGRIARAGGKVSGGVSGTAEIAGALVLLGIAAKIALGAG